MSAIESQKENPLVSLIVNIALPAVILAKFSTPEALGQVGGLVIALSFPFFYGLYDFVSRKKFNFIAALGLVSVLLTGGFSLLQLDTHWIAVKEAAIPGAIGVFVILSAKMGNPLVKTILLNDQLVNVDLLNQELKDNGKEDQFLALLQRASLMVAASFFVSSGLNYGLAKWLLVSPAGTTAHNEELGMMTAYSWPVIVLPSTLILLIALFRLFKGIHALTGLELDAILKSQPKK